MFVTSIVCVRLYVCLLHVGWLVGWLDCFVKSCLVQVSNYSFKFTNRMFPDCVSKIYSTHDVDFEKNFWPKCFVKILDIKS